MMLRTSQHSELTHQKQPGMTANVLTSSTEFTWLRCEEYVFGTKYPQSHNSLSLSFANFVNATIHNSFSFKIN